MNHAVFRSSLTPSDFAEVNARCLRLGLLTKQRVLTAAPEGRFLTRADATPVIVWNNRVLGLPLPRREIQKVLTAMTESTLIVVFGIGTGYLAKYLRQVTTAPVIVYEPNVGLLRLLMESGPLDFDDIQIVTNHHDLSLVWGRYSGRRRDAVVINTPGYSAAFPEDCASLPQSLTRLVERVTITKNTYRKRAQTWVLDVLANLSVLESSTPLLGLEGAFTGIPAFIVGAGPSLDKNIDELRRAKHKGIVFAANSSALSLAKHQIAPHVVCCLESIDISDRLRTLPYLDEVIRAFSLSSHPNTLKVGSGPLMPFHEALPQYAGPLEAITRVPGVTVCGSVSTAAFSLAQRLGCSPIVLVGQDMAFTDGATYAGGTGYETSRASVDKASGRVRLHWNEQIQSLHGDQHGTRHDSEPLVETTAWGGEGTVVSGPSFMAINAWLESTAAVSEEIDPDRRYVNATEGGARVIGFAEERLGALLDGLPDTNIEVSAMAQLAAERLPPLSRRSIVDWLTAQADQTKDVARKARRVWRLSRHALHTMTNNDPATIGKGFAKLDDAEIELRRAVAQVPLVDAWSHTDVDALVVSQTHDIHGDSRQSAQYAVELGLKVAAAIEQAAHELERHLRSASMPLETQEAKSKGNSQCR
jgi:uncharacterized membrane protein